jgi:hypothetical protein
MSNFIKQLVLFSAIAGLGFLGCGVLPVQTAGGSSDTEISAKTIVGSVVDQNGNAVPNAAVMLNKVVAEGINPANPDNHMPPNPEPLDTLVIKPVITDEHGIFRIPNVNIGQWAIEINSGDSLAVLVYCSFDSGDSVKRLPVDTLRPMVIISGTLLPDGSQNPSITVDGLTRRIHVDSTGRFQIKVPAGNHRVRFSSHGPNQRNSINLPYLPPGAELDIGYIDPSSTPIPAPCQDSACDASAMSLILSDMGLSSVPIESVAVFTNGRITAINLRHRGLRSLSPEIARLTALVTLDAGANQLRSPFQAVSSCTSLSVLRLDSNYIPYLPNSIGSMRNLVELDLSNNEISSLPISIINLSPEILKLDGNRLLDISGAAAQWADGLEPNWRATQRSDKNPYPNSDGITSH